jgi:hypothetical protein
MERCDVPQISERQILTYSVQKEDSASLLVIII